MNSPNDHAELTSRTQKAIYMQKVKVTWTRLYFHGTTLKHHYNLNAKICFSFFVYNVLPYFLKDDDTVKKMNILWIGERSLVNPSRNTFLTPPSIDKTICNKWEYCSMTEFKKDSQLLLVCIFFNIFTGLTNHDLRTGVSLTLTDIIRLEWLSYLTQLAFWILNNESNRNLSHSPFE